MGGGHSAVRNGRVVRSGHDEGTYGISMNEYTMLLGRIVQSAFRVSTAARLPLGKEGQTYRRWIAVGACDRCDACLAAALLYGCTWECTGTN
eukprot:scaffold187044_cov42-Attheya_sp.AAC.1